MNESDSSKTVDFPTRFEFDFADQVEGAGFWIRFLARVIDIIVHYVIAIIAIILVVVVASLVAVIMGSSPDLVTENLDDQTLLGYVLAILGSVAYHTFCEGIHGSTLGKLICGLVVVKEDGTYCGLFSALGRSFAFYIDGLFFGIPALVSMNATVKRQRLGDRWAKTMVVKKRDLEDIVQVRSGIRFVIVFLGGMILDGVILGFAQILELVG